MAHLETSHVSPKYYVIFRGVGILITVGEIKNFMTNICNTKMVLNK